MRRILLAAYVGIAPLTCHAEERGGRSSPALAPIEAKLKRCTAENPGNIPERLCTDDARQAVDGVLTRIYAQIVAGLKRPTDSSVGDSRNKEVLRRLVASERAWIAYRDSECLERSGSMLGGSGEATILVECEYSLERDRVNDLFDLYKDELPEIAK
jgi:uncharacterized protein YecT (DUF1311 family)